MELSLQSPVGLRIWGHQYLQEVRGEAETRGTTYKSESRGGTGRVGERRKREEIWGYMYMYG